MKRIMFLLIFAMCSIITMANNTDPSNQSIKKSDPTQSSVDCKPDAQCEMCGTCRGRDFCVGCNCSANDCSAAFDILMEIMCLWNSACCFGDEEEGPGGPGGGGG